jgi:predicted nucleic acid-binding Zn ribbon protein
MPSQTCLVCGKPTISRGLCGRHYKRYSTEGFPELTAWILTAEVMPRPLRREPYPEKACGVCQRAFVPARKNQKICLDVECAAQNKRDMANSLNSGRSAMGQIERECVVCGAGFQGHFNSLVCGRACRMARNNELNRQAHGSVQPQCLVCGKRLPFQGGVLFTCPGECRAIAQKRRARRVYQKNPGRRERCVEARRIKIATDPAYAQRIAEQDLSRRRRDNRLEFEAQVLAAMAKLAENRGQTNETDQRD